MEGSSSVFSRGFDDRHCVHQHNRGVIECLPCDELSAETIADLEEIQVSIEEPWTTTIEDKLLCWLAEAEESGRKHKDSGFKLKHRYRLFTFIVLFWSAVILVANDAIGCNADYSEQISRLIINAFGVFLNALFSSLNMGYTYRMHFEYETKFYELSQDIHYVLVRGRDYREAADSFMTEIRERRKKLALAPELVGNKFFGC